LSSKEKKQAVLNAAEISHKHADKAKRDNRKKIEARRRAKGEFSEESLAFLEKWED